MQIDRAEVVPVELTLKHPVRMANIPEIHHVTAIFVRIQTRQGQSAWGCTLAHPDLTGETPEEVLQGCQRCASLIADLHPTNIEYSLDILASQGIATSSVLCAFDLAFHDLLGLAAGMPLYRLLGGYRDRIQTSVTIPITSVRESVEIAKNQADMGFRMLKIKGGLNPEEDVQRVHAIHRVLPNHVLRLDADGGYTIQEALDVARALQDILEFFEQPTPAEDLALLGQLKESSQIPILADQSLKGPASALELCTNKSVDGLSIKLATCGGIRCARLVDAIARAARITTMISCLIEPALLITAGLSLALSSPNVKYGDLDGHLEIANDPSLADFSLKDGWLIASDLPGLGSRVEFA